MQLSILTTVAGLAATTCAQKVKVMLLGDSITEISCWRPLVWDQITSAGLVSSVDFVGSMSNLQGKCSRPAGFDPNHEGHSGWQAYDIARNNIVGWVQDTKPDIVQFMLGTNDVNIGKRNVQTILDSYTIMLDAMRAANPSVKVIVDKLIPTSWSDATIEALNSAIPSWVQSHTAPQSPIAIADCSRAAGFTNAMLATDGVHPNGQGDQFLAKQIGPQLLQFINDVRGGGSGNPSATVTTSVTTLRTSTTAGSPQPTDGGGGCAPLWSQCAGQGWTGPTCCAEGICTFANDWYSQCV